MDGKGFCTVPAHGHTQREQERKARTNRLCKRMGHFEKLLPDTIPLTEEQFKTFLEKTVLTEYSRRILDGLTARNAAAAPAQGAGMAARGNTQPTAKAAPTAQESGADGSRNGGAAHGDLPLQYQNHLPRQGQVRR